MTPLIPSHTILSGRKADIASYIYICVHYFKTYAILKIAFSTFIINMFIHKQIVSIILNACHFVWPRKIDVTIKCISFYVAEKSLIVFISIVRDEIIYKLLKHILIHYCPRIVMYPDSFAYSLARIISYMKTSCRGKYAIVYSMHEFNFRWKSLT